MAFNVGSITAELELNGQQFIATLKNADEVLGSFSQSASSAAKESSAFGEVLTGALRRLGELTFDAVIDGVKSVIGLFGEAIKASDEFEANIQSLDVALKLRNLGGLKDGLVESAIALEGVTKFSRNTVLEVQKLLTVFGVRKSDLDDFTKSVLDFSHATGFDAVTAARLFGRSLSGSVGRLSQYIPDAKNLGEQALKMGGAFKLVSEQLGGFAQAAANTSAAIEERFGNAIKAALQSLGDTLSPVLDVFFVLGREAALRFSTALGDPKNNQLLLSAFAKIGEVGVRAFLLIAQGAAGILPTLGTILRFVGQLNAAWVTFKATVLGAIMNFSAALAEVKVIFAGVSELVSRLPGFSQATRDAAKTALADAKNDLLGVMQASSELNSAIIDSAKAANDFGVQMNQAADELDKTKSIADTMLDGFKTDAAEASDTLSKLAAGTKAVADGTENIAGKSRESLALYRSLGVSFDDIKQKILEQAHGLGVAKKAAGEVQNAVQQIGAAASETSGKFGEWVDSISNANRALQQTAGSISDAGAAAGGGGMGGGLGTGGFHAGGTRSFATANAAQTAATLVSLQGRAVGIATITQRSNANFYNQLVAKLRSQIQDETKAFTSGIIDELNRQGIFDPTQRSSYISQRFDEARRLGVLPRGATYNATTGTFGGYG